MGGQPLWVGCSPFLFKLLCRGCKIIIMKSWLASGFLLAATMLNGSAQNLINIKPYNSSLSGISGAAVVGTAGDAWNLFGNLQTNSTGFLTNAATIKDSSGATLSGVSMTLAIATTTQPLSGFSSTAFNPLPLAIMQNYIYDGNGDYYTVVFSGLPANKPYLICGMGTGNAQGQGTTWWADTANGHASATCTANFTSGTPLGARDATAATNESVCFVKIPATTTAAGVLTFRVCKLGATESGGVVTGGSGRAYFNAFQLQPASAPVISNLTNQTVIAGNNAVLNPTITGVPTPSYQWRSNSVAITGATNSSLTLNNVQSAQNSTVYSLVASNWVGSVTNSMTLTVIVPPNITGLNNQAVSVGANVTIAPSVSGVPAPALRWQFNGGNISDGATGHGSTLSGSATSTLALLNSQVADSGSYSLIASNSAGIVTNSMTLTVSSGNVAPQITGPSDQTVVHSNNATFTASVSGLPVPTLQWRVNGTDIPGAIGSSLTVTNVQFAQNGFVYSLVASNSVGSATNSATLFVLVPPSISQQPPNVSASVGSTAVFSVTASGVPTVKYQWRKNGSPIANATNASYTTPNVTGADNGAVFSVVVSNSVSSVTSSNAVLTVLSTMTGAFLPTNNATGIAPDQQLRLVFPNPIELFTNGVIQLRDAVNNSVVATIDAAQFVTYVPGNASATIPNAAVRTVQGATYYYMPIAIYGNEAWITFTNRLAYNKTYYVTMDAGLLRDTNNASIAAVTGTNTWRFSTKSSGLASPTTSTGPTNIFIGQDGTGDFATFQGAFDWIPQNNTLARTIRVKAGIYRDNATLAQNRNFVTIVGDGTSRTNAQLIYPFAYFTTPFTAGSLRIESSDVTVLNLTLDNIIYQEYHPTGDPSSGAVGAFAGAINTLATTGRRIVLDNVLIKGGQDTIYHDSTTGVVYFRNCEVWGSVDYIYGTSLAVYDQCTVVEIRSTGGPITAPNTAYAQPYGLVFLNCTFPRALIANGYPYDVGTSTTTFQRPWQQDGATAIINCQLDSQLSTKGWSEWVGAEGAKEVTCRAREYGSTLIGGGAAPTPAQRQTAGAYWLNTIDPDYTGPPMQPLDPLVAPGTGTGNRVAVTVNPADYTLDAIFGNAYFSLGTWRPNYVPVILAQPTNLTVNATDTATFSVTAMGLPAPTYQWKHVGTNLLNQTNTTLTLTNVSVADVGAYSVIVSNSAGSVSSSTATLTAIGFSAPQITTQPTNTTATYGSNATFTVAASGVPAPVYQWRKNGAVISGATNASLTLTNAQVTDIATYSVVASNSIGSVISSNATFNLTGANGFAMVNGTTIGGTGGTVVTVTNGTDFNTQINIAGPRIIQVQGVISISEGTGDGRSFTTANKTIVGLGTNAMLLGNLNLSDSKGATNVIIQNLRISCPGADGLTIWGATNVWVDHCTFYDCGDGSVDMNNGSQYVTVSWCKFFYTNQLEHRFVSISDGYTNTTAHVVTYGYYTFHHNWFSTRCDQRQASSSYGRLHYYNNYWNCTNNSYASLARVDTQILSQNNYYSGVNNPLYKNTGNPDELIQSSGNIYSGCTGSIDDGNDTVFTPPYGYLLDATADVPAIVMAGAGAAGPDMLPVPPKIWDGGGANNNLSTSGNWGFNEIPKYWDTLVFAGSTRLAPNNNLAVGAEFDSLVFSNNAGAFVLGGSLLNFGGSITDDSSSVQTINANLDFIYGLFHYSSNRYVNVSSPSGSLVINGNLTGTNSPTYFSEYCLIKQGAGLLTLNGTNPFTGWLKLDGGMVQFKSLATNQPGSIGDGDRIEFNGGGLRWAAGNTADISPRTVTIQSNGATFDVGANNVTFANRIGNSGSGGLVKLGSGMLQFNATNNYKGNTIIGDGVLALGTAGLLTNSPQIILSNNAVLDVSGRADGTQLLPSGKSLIGSGTVRGSVTAASGATISPGLSIGTLLITNALTFQSGSTNFMEINAATHTNDLITGMNSVSYGGKLIVTNLGGTLAAGDSFKLFSAGSYNNSFTNISLPALTGNLFWTNKLALNGTLAVISPVNTAVTNLGYAVNGAQLQLSWPNDHTGWRLETQTNGIGAGLGTNWSTVSGSALTNQIWIPMNSTNGSVFFRLVYP